MPHYLTMAAAVVFWFIAGMIFLYGDGAWKFTAVTPLFLGCVAAVRYYYLLSQDLKGQPQLPGDYLVTEAAADL